MRKTFHELMEETSTALHNSNMQNLVSLARRLEDEEAELTFQLEWTKQQRVKVAELANNVDLQTTDAVHAIYNEQRPAFKGRRW